MIIQDVFGEAESFAVTLIVAGIACYFIEKIKPAQKDTPFFKKEFRKELALAVLNALIFTPAYTLLIAVTLLALLGYFMPHQIFDKSLTQLPLALQVFFGVLIMDLATYWRHRFTHRHLWPYHAFHHSAEEITWLTSLRLHPLEILVAMLFDTTILYILGFSGSGIIFAAVIVQIYNYFTHMNIDINFPKPIRYIFASPHYHRWHHAADKAAYDKNFCGVFSFLDVIFGTYYHPDELPKAYGLSPREQQEVPEKLLPHLILPIKKDIKKIRGRLERKLAKKEEQIS